MRKIVLIIWIAFGGLTGQNISINAQDIVVNVSGVVIDIETGSPISNHEIQLDITAGGMLQQFDLQTNMEGSFFKDSIFANGSGNAVVRLYDCFNEMHEFEQMFNQAQTNLFFDIFICGDSLTDCSALYTWDYVPGNNQHILFSDLSIGNYDERLWDFGDSNTSNEPNPVHQYNAPGLYNVCLTISSAQGNCNDMFCQIVQVDSTISDCENWFEYLTNDNQTFEFMGFSIPEALEYYWDFGDGNFSFGPAVTHTYSSDSSGFYDVSLTTIHFTPSGGDSCVAVSTQSIFVGTNCEAYFEATQNPSDPLTWNFDDLSPTIPDLWFWDFGDGTISEEPNPTHTFQNTGTFNVCLTIVSDSLGFVCTDTYCDTIEVNYSIQAAFAATLDTVSGQTNRYIFTDLSSGNPDSWLWDFGDGNTSSEQNPAHIFDQSGSYQTCLTVSRTVGNVLHQDQFCLNHNTPNYFDFGGTVFLGNSPMNNVNGDTTIVDVAMAYLYRRYDDLLIPTDTTIFHQYGYYYFTDVREGEYLIKIELLESSEHFGQFLPAYHLNSRNWTSAQQLQLFEENTYAVNVHMDPLDGLINGPGSISGQIEFTGSDIATNEQLQGVEIYIMDESLTPVAYHKTDDIGSFNFTNIALGTYYLHAESAGFYTVTEMVELTETNNSVLGVNLQLHTQILSAPELDLAEFEIRNVYPNPAHNKLNIAIVSEHNDAFEIMISDITGKIFYTESKQIFAGEQLIKLDASRLPKGFYLLNLKSEETRKQFVKKFIK